jgi:hypothetical protein
MQRHLKGRQVQIPRRWAAEQLAGELGEANNRRSIERAEAFLEAEEADSGIVVRRGSDIRFWHLTFQEYLAARGIAARLEAEQRELLLGPGRALYVPEWREAMLLLGGVLHQQGRAKVDGLVGAVLDDLFKRGEPTLAAQARAAGVLGAIVRDLSPFAYAPADPRYAELLQAVMGIFERDRARGIPIEVRIEAAEALGAAGDPRLDDESLRWVEIDGGRFLMGAQSKDRGQPGYDAEAQEDETPRWAELDGFRLGRWPVTVAEGVCPLRRGGGLWRRAVVAGGRVRRVCGAG